MKTITTAFVFALLATGCTSQSHNSASSYTQTPLSVSKFVAYNHSNYFYGKPVTIKDAKVFSINTLHKIHEGYAPVAIKADETECVIGVPFKLYDEFAAAMVTQKNISFEGVGAEIKSLDQSVGTILVTRILPEEPHQ